MKTHCRLLVLILFSVTCSGTFAGEIESLTSTGESDDDSREIVEGIAHVYVPPLIEPKYTTELPDSARITFTLKTIENIVTGGSGLATEFDGDPSVEVTMNLDGPFGSLSSGNYAGISPDFPQPTGQNVSQFFYSGCGSEDAFPLDFSSTVDIGDGLATGNFAELDDMTVVPPGNWTFHYEIDVADGDGNTSTFVFKGDVVYECVIN